MNSVPQWYPIAPDVAHRLACESDIEIRDAVGRRRPDIPRDILARMAR